MAAHVSGWSAYDDDVVTLFGVLDVGADHFSFMRREQRQRVLNRIPALFGGAHDRCVRDGRRAGHRLLLPLRGPVMKSSLRLGRVAGIDVGIHYTWLFAFALIAWSLAAGFFPSTIPGLAAATYWLLGIAAALGLFASVLIHEFSHSLVALTRGLRVQSITLFIFGGVSTIVGAGAGAGGQRWTGCRTAEGGQTCSASCGFATSSISSGLAVLLLPARLPDWGGG